MDEEGVIDLAAEEGKNTKKGRKGDRSNDSEGGSSKRIKTET